MDRAGDRLLSELRALVDEPGVVDHGGPYPVAPATFRTTDRTSDVQVVGRDTATVEELAQRLLERNPPTSLRELDANTIRWFISQRGPDRTALTGLKRFVRFLRDTDRLDFQQATNALLAAQRALGGGRTPAQAAEEAKGVGLGQATQTALAHLHLESLGLVVQRSDGLVQLGFEQPDSRV